MSRVFKSTHVNLGQPLEVVMAENDIIYRKRPINRSSDLSGQNPTDAASTIIDDANIQADEIVAQAQAQAQEIVASAYDEIEQLKQNAQREGYEAGYRQGLQDGRMETEELAHQALEIKEEIEEERNDLVDAIEARVINLIIQSVRKITGRELATDKEVIAGVVTNALNRISSGEPLVRVSEEDFEVLEKGKNEILSESEITDFEIIKDLSLKKGECIIETDCGNIDASVNTQLDKFEEVISDIMGRDTDV